MTRDEWLSIGGPTRRITTQGNSLVTAEDFLNVAHRLMDGTRLQLTDAQIRDTEVGTVRLGVTTGQGMIADVAAASLLLECWPHEITPVGLLVLAVPLALEVPADA